uniref:Nephrin n=1 Tax=Panagrellus redivivus TaxID=6233 RepID=A0A7E4VGA4_PANRE
MKWLAVIATALLALLVNAKPRGFRELPQNVSQIIGSDVILRCSAYPSGTEHDLHSQWRSNTGALLGFRDAGTLPGHDGRYSYIRESPDELHLKIERLELDDDGVFECQMVRQEVGPLRATAAVNVIVAPTEVTFVNYKEGTVLELQEDSALNVTCVSPNAKPAPKMSWYLNGKVVSNQVNSWDEYNPNKTVVAYTTATLRPTKSEHNKVLTCESLHNETGTRLRTSVTLHVLYSSERPKIDVVGGGENIKAGQNVTLVCSAKGGNPPPNLSWYLNDRPIGTLYSYDFSSQITRNEYSFVVEGSDNGAVYECRSSNRPNIPALRRTITLSVKYPAANVFLYGNTTVRRGDQLQLSCVSGPSNPPSVISWTVNDAQLRPQAQNDKRMAAGISTESNITIDYNMILSGQKEVVATCVATNEEGSASQRHVIRVLIPPEQPFIYGAESGPMLEGEVLNITCESAGGNPAAELSWYRGIEKKHSKHNHKHKLRWKQLRGGVAKVTGELSSNTIGIKLDRSMNTMPLRCEALNGAIDEPLVALKAINVLFPPRRLILRQPENDRRQMISGEAARLSCTVPSANPPAEVTWQFEKKGLETPRYTVSYNRTERATEYSAWEVKQVITFTADEKLDGTAVQCIASHPLWNDVVVAEHKLSIFYPPRVETQGPISVDIEEGSSFQKNLSITSNPPVSAWRWRKNGIGFDGTIGSVYARGSIIGGRSVGPADSGIYTVLASNLFGTVNVSMKVNVRYPARIIYITSPVIASVGEDVVLECEADGMPNTSGMVKWMRRDSELKSVIREQKRAVLRLNASHETSGAYTCVADNGVGPANYTSAYLLVKKAPQILRNRGHDRAAGPIGGRAKVVCHAVGVPDASFQWSIEGENNVIQYNSTKYLVHETQLDFTNFESTLWIMDLNEMDYSRRVRCRVSNQLGHDSIYITVSTPSAPDVPSNLEVIRVTNDSVALGWQPGFDGGADQVFELRLQMEGDKHTHSLNFSRSQAIINNLQPEKVYFAQIRAVNEHHRSSEFSLPAVEIRTLDEMGAEVVSTYSSSPFSSTTIYAAVIVIVLLILANCCIVCFMRQRKRQKKLHEKTEYARTTTLMNTADGSVRPVQTYGAVGTPSMRRRPDSSNTNRSELLNDRASEDDQSVRTMIEVSPNGCMQRYDPNCIVDYEFNPELYSCLNRNLLDAHGVTYAAMPYPEPPRGHNGGYSPLEQQEVFTYTNRHPDLIVGGPSGMSTLRRGSLNNNNTGTLHRHESPALSTFIPSGSVRTTTDPHALNGDLV